MKIDKLDYYGRGILKLNNKIIFVENALKDEDVDIKIIKEKKKYNEAVVTNYNKKSDIRVTPKCKYYDICGGCNISHIKDLYQEEFKENKIKELFRNINVCEYKKIEYNKFYNYRYKIVLHINKDKIGLYKKRSNNLIEIDKCMLVHDKINDVIKVLKEIVKKETNLNKATIKLGNITNEVMLVLEGVINDYSELLKVVDVLIINDKKITKKDYIISNIGNMKYKISKNSFFQVNPYITEKIYNDIKSIIKKLNSKNVLDLYCGTGTIGIYISQLVDKIIGIEVVNDAIVDARYNRKINNIDNISFILGKVEDKINNTYKDIDTVIVDPPRSGLDKNVIEVINKLEVKNIIYVSCNPNTLVRDIELLKDNYNIDYIKPYDMFPNTYHVECLSLLSRKSSC